MPRFELVRESEAPTSFRAAKVRGMFDVPDRKVERVVIEGAIPLEELGAWNVGLITGHSGTGKSTIARELFGERLAEAGEWSGACLLDDFPSELSADEVVGALTAVGLSSPPVWLRPYRVLSTGQQFRADLARALTRGSNLVAYDEFTSVVDRQVAKAAAHAVQKMVRRSGKQFVAVTCHSDVAEWLEADWVYDSGTGHFARGRLQRPGIKVSLYPGHSSAWRLFHEHHYLSGDLLKTARVFLAYVDLGEGEQLAAFFATKPMMGMRGWDSVHRMVVLPDFQGLGIGGALAELVGETTWRHFGRRMRGVAAARSMIYHFGNRPDRWRCVSVGKQNPSGRSRRADGRTRVRTASGRLTTSWEYIPEAMRRAATASGRVAEAPS